MHFIEVIYISAAIIALSAGAPQLRQLFITKASDELSLLTWCIWFVTQCTTLVYVTALGNVLMMVANAAWVGFYAAMVGTIIYYRRYKPLPQESVLVEEEL